MKRIGQGSRAVVAVFALYCALRWISAWRRILLEDHDSVGYIEQIRAFLSLDFSRIASLGPDMTPFYPLFGALCSAPGWGAEAGARLASLLFSIVLFLALASIGRRIAAPEDVTWGLAILAVCPVLVRLSGSVLSEPAYIGLVYLGLALFWIQCAEPSRRMAVVVAIVFAIAFLTRTEGILYLLVPLFFQATHFLLVQDRTYDGKRLLQWCGTYIITFSICIAPQLMYVSAQVGEPAINGRQIWSEILNAPDGKTYDGKIYGLDYSDEQINLLYLQSHPKQRAQLKSESRIGSYVGLIARNFDEFYQKGLGMLIGPVVMILFGFGLFALFERRRVFEIVIILSFMAISLIGPLLHNVVQRHIAVIAPIVFLVAGVGVTWLIGRVTAGRAFRHAGRVTVALVIVATLAGWAYPMQRALRASEHNDEYDPGAMAAMVGMVEEIARTELHRPARIAGRKGYFALLAGGERVPLPYTDYAGLLDYCRLNAVDFLLIEEELVRDFPFVANFEMESERDPAMQLIYSGSDRAGRKLRLYRVHA